MATLNPTDLENATLAIFKDNTRANDYGFRSDMRVENLFTVSYKSRYFLELLQNARDAIVEGKIKGGKVKAWVDGEVFYFANNGADFTADGVWSICYPAISTKTDLSMVGHKGIGFNAVREISVTPEIITKFGTIFFDVQQAMLRLERTSPNLPLFRYPMYNEQTIFNQFPTLAAEGYTTIFKFPLMDEISADELDMAAPAVEDLIYLSAIKRLEIQELIIDIDDNNDFIVANGPSGERNFKRYYYPFELSKANVDTFTADEKAQFENSREVECAFLLERDSEGRFKKTKNAKLHLYYGLDFLTGFSFSLHSYFSVTLERKSLVKDSKLNRLLFENIAAFCTSDLLFQLKAEFPGQELEILAFTRQANNWMDKLYDFIRDGLREKDFIFHPQLNRYFRPEQLVIASKDDYQVFRDGKLDEKFLMISGPYDTFLQKEMKVESLGSNLILKGIEAKCEQFKNDPSFFEDLYKLILSRTINASSKTILLTASGNLVSGSETDLYYQPKAKLRAPEVLESDIAFLHPDIGIDNLRGGLNKYLSINEFNETALLRRAVKLLSGQENSTAKGQNLIIELLHFIVQLELTDSQLVKNLKGVIVLPVRDFRGGNVTWARPVQVPMYFTDFSFAELYDNQFLVVDFSELRIPEVDSSIWRTFLLGIGVWEIPGIFLKTTPGEEHTPYPDSQVFNDPTLHIPVKIDESFYMQILSSWNDYEDFITSDRGADTMKIDTGIKLHHANMLKYSSFLSQLKNLRWIPALKYDDLFGSRVSNFYAPTEIVLLGSSESTKNHNTVVFEFFAVSQMDQFMHRELITAFDIIRIQPDSIESCVAMLQFFRKEYLELQTVENKKGIRNLANRILSFMYEFLNKTNEARHIDQLKKQHFLAEGIMDGELIWLLGADCLHIDDKNFLDVLIENDLLDGLTNPYAFTKKDKKEWGKFGNKIGRAVRKMVRITLDSSGKPDKLLSNINFPDVLIGFIENDLDSNYKDEDILAFNDVYITVHAKLEMCYSLEDKTHKVIQPYYVTEGKLPMLHINRDSLSNRHLLALALGEWVDGVVGTDLVRFYLIIERILEMVDHTSAKNYAIDHDIDENRIQQIADLLKYNYFIADETVPTATPITIKASQTQPSPIRTTLVNVIQDRQEISLEIDGELTGYFDMLDGKVGEPTSGFVPRNIPSAGPIPPSPLAVSNGLPAIRMAGAELNDKGKMDIGFLGELFIHKKLCAKEITLLALLGFNPQMAIDIEWLNLHRKTNYSLADRSRGHGHDFILKAHDIAIEVKGMMGDAGYITVTGKEMDSMRFRGDRYFLIVVRHILSGGFRPLVIQNPYQKIISGELFFIEAKLLL